MVDSDNIQHDGGMTTRPLPGHGSCFVCGDENPHGMGVTWRLREDGVIVTEIVFTEAQQGPPGHVHGGAIAAVLDEAMGAAVWRAGFGVAAVNLNIDYRRPIPLHQPISISARISDQEGRAIRARGEMYLPGGGVAAVGRGIYVEAPHLFEKAFYREE